VRLTCVVSFHRFRDFHVVAKPPHIRSYIGTPIVLANGYRVGVLCALDTKPHAMAASSTRLMVNVAGLVAREIEGLAGADYDLPLQPKVWDRERERGQCVIQPASLITYRRRQTSNVEDTKTV